MSYESVANSIKAVLEYDWPDNATDEDRAQFYLPPCRFAPKNNIHQVTVEDYIVLNSINPSAVITNAGADIGDESSTQQFQDVYYTINIELYAADVAEDLIPEIKRTLAFEVYRRIAAFPILDAKHLQIEEKVIAGEPLTDEELAIRGHVVQHCKPVRWGIPEDFKILGEGDILTALTVAVWEQINFDYSRDARLRDTDPTSDAYAAFPLGSSYSGGIARNGIARRLVLDPADMPGVAR